VFDESNPDKIKDVGSMNQTPTKYKSSPAAREKRESRFLPEKMACPFHLTT